MLVVDGATPLDLGVMLRALRRAADLSQRELAGRAGMQHVMVSRIESGKTRNPSFRTVERLVHAAGGRLDCDASGVEPIPHERSLDNANRHFPAHLDLRDVLRPRDWSGAWWELTHAFPRPMPPVTCDVRRDRRDQRRLRLEARQHAVIRRTGEWSWAADLAGEVIGDLRAVHEDGEVRIVWLRVARERRGGDVGRRLVTALLAEADAAGARVVRVATDVGFGFFQRLGFRTESQLRLVVLSRRR